ncbi:MAG TPA: FAD-binding oxidoreductase, partial [Actinobacteria bacterium]|nr:FAD-binding oxidoreductase [Actinomycetota bacterium]
CLKYGLTIHNVLAVRAVDADGDVIEAGGEALDCAGYDLLALLTGSEGNLGVITRVTTRLLPLPERTETLLAAFPSVRQAAGAVGEIIGAGIIPAALEMMDRPLIRAVENFVHAGLPVDAAAVLLAEVTGHPVGIAAEADLIVAAALRNGAFDVRVAADQAERDLLWKARKSAFGAIAQIAPDYYLHDVVVPRTRLVETLEAIYEIARRHDLLVLNTIHAGDGNLHPKFVYDATIADQAQRVKQASGEVVRLAIAFGGALSGEHGIGLEKRDLMPLSFSAIDLDAQARLREAFDPEKRFNPGSMLPAGSRCFDFGRAPMGPPQDQVSTRGRVGT